MKSQTNFNGIEKTTLTWEVRDEDLNISENLTFIHSRHSFKRANKRNINNTCIALTIEYGIAFFKQGLIFYVLGDKVPDIIRKKLGKGNLNLIVVVSGNSNIILTCYRSKNPFKHIKKKQKNLAKQFDFAA
ncbi:hypothetical protein ITJ86_05135 [Winogradskyella sp. F6397]|uniref:DUF4258 domain-containing protein n=1 Tax=Winogradskyella marina TaxID=2785530 RepID=A0ABS0EG82_9FLAO|nr:hypothetical protein [Winogradskyella marina]MBF8149268.1 hypothetical protein [Winogradskyella marina]